MRKRLGNLGYLAETLQQLSQLHDSPRFDEDYKLAWHPWLTEEFLDEADRLAEALRKHLSAAELF